MNNELLFLDEREKRAFEWAWRESTMSMAERAQKTDSLPEPAKLAAVALCDPLFQTLSDEEVTARSQAFYASIPDKAFVENWVHQQLAQARAIGSSIPYHEEFLEGYSEWVSICPLTHAVDQISRHVVSWDVEYATFFNSIQGGYRYLADTLTVAGDLYPDFDTRSLRRSIEWLDRHAKQFGNPEAEAPALYATPKPTPVLGASQVELLHITKEELALVLAECGVTPSSKPGKWAAISSALRRLHMLDGSHAAVQRWFTEHFGAPASIRRTLTDKGDYNAVFANQSEKLTLDKAKQLFEKYRTAR